MVGRAIRVALWNVEWTPPRSRRAEVIRQYLCAADPDIICLTEAYAGFLAGAQAWSRAAEGAALEQAALAVV